MQNGCGVSRALASYHARVGAKIKRSLLQEWQEGAFVVMVATVAFGMGIDESHVPLVVHVSFPFQWDVTYRKWGGRAAWLVQEGLCSAAQTTPHWPKVGVESRGGKEGATQGV